MNSAPENRGAAGDRSPASVPELDIPRLPVMLWALNYRVDCPFCGRPHHHGRGGGLGLRTAHCGRGQYILVAGDHG